MRQMILHEHERYGMIRLFETFIAALARLVDNDSVLFTWPKNHITISHRLAQHLEQVMFGELPVRHQEAYVVDLCVPILEDFRALIPDILVHNRKEKEGQRLIAITCRTGYLTEKELLYLHDFKNKAGCHLTLAIAFLPQKDYMLIYRADETTIDYYHFFREEKHCQLLKRRQISDVGDRHQLKLGIKTGKRSVPRQ
ncbi:MAG: hypothetical protein PHS67_05565 [Sphaerochaetaceae bacterium]|nr:hypothetical protein [Sphaerochaetaceae bacterium]